MPIAVTTMMLQPNQVRAGRAIIGLTMDEFAAAAGISSQTILRLENGETTASRSTTARIADALTRFGVELLGEDDGHGVGVRMREPAGDASIVRRDALRKQADIGVVARIDGKPTTARLAIAALTPDGDADEALLKFDAQRPQIAQVIASKLRAGDFDPAGHIRIVAEDLKA